MSTPAWWANDKGWWRCDHCGEAIKPRPAVPTPEVPMEGTNGRTLNWVHRACNEALTARLPPSPPGPPQ